MTEKDCVISTRDGGRKLYWNGKSWTALWTAAVRYTEAGAKRKGKTLADAYGLPMRVETVEAQRWPNPEKNPVPPSSRAGAKLPESGKVQKARARYTRFTGHKAQDKARIVNEDDKAFLRVGTVDGLLYTTNRDGKVEKYIHHFRPKSRPELLVSHDGKVARTLGGHFTFTERGFVDEDANGRPVE